MPDKPMSDSPRRRRAGGRAGNPRRAVADSIEQTPWRIPFNTDLPTEPLDEEGVREVHDGAMRVLEEIGIEILNEEALVIFGKMGCIVDGANVRMGREMAMELVAAAPSEFTITPRNRARELTIGNGHMVFGNVSSPPNYWDMELGRKVPGNRTQCRNLLKLTQYFNCIHLSGGYPVEPADIHPSIRHLDVLHDKMTLTDKVTHAYSLGRERVEDAMEMVRIAAGIGHEEFESRPHMYTNINSTSPLKHDRPMLDGWMRLARRNQGLVVTPFTLAGAMAPVTIAGAVAQSLAEALIAVALAQYIRPGASCAIGTFTSNVDMKSGAPAFGTPEYVKAAFASGQLARRYRLPWRSSNVNASNTPDAQAAYESQMALWGALMGGANILMHGAGWLEGGLTASFEKFIIDVEMLQGFAQLFQPVPCDEDALGLAAVREVGPSGHYFGAAHTLERYNTAFYEPLLSDWRNFENWSEAGAETATLRAHRIYKDRLAQFEPPPMADAIREELEAFVARRTEEGGADLEA